MIGRVVAVALVLAVVLVFGFRAFVPRADASVGPVDGRWQAQAVAVASLPVPARWTAPRRSAAVTARATWYCLAGRSRCTRGWDPSCLCAAVSPDLAARLGRFVTVSRGSVSVRVRIVDCLCSRPGGIDLYARAFRLLAPLSVGAVPVKLFGLTR